MPSRRPGPDAPANPAEGGAGSILLVLPWSPSLPGGVSVVVRYLHEHLASHPLTPVLMVDNWGADRLRVGDDGIPAFRFAILGPVTPRGLLKAAVIAPVRLARTLQLLRGTRARSVNFHYPSLDVLGVALLKRLGLYRGCLALSFHGTDLRPPGSTIERALWQFALSQADGISACSTDLAARLAAAFGLEAGRVAVIHNGVDPDVFSPGARNGRMRARLPRRYVASIGSYLPRKAHRVLLEAFAALAAEFPDVSLAIAGMRGPEQGPLQELAARLGLSERVAFFVDLSHADTATLLAGAEACVQPAHAEPFGLAIIEAGACGVPVAASAVSGHTEILRDRETGLLFPAGDEAACAAALRRLLNDRVAARSAADRFRAEVLQRYGWRECAQAYFALNAAAPAGVRQSASLARPVAR